MCVSRRKSQVMTNLESKRRQYDLVDVARQRGFDAVSRPMQTRLTSNRSHVAPFRSKGAPRAVMRTMIQAQAIQGVTMASRSTRPGP
jgi:hypothetical protein